MAAAAPPLAHIAVSWDEIRRDSVALADKVRARGSWHGIVAVARGGLVPAALVARALGLRCVETVSVASYEREKLGTPALIKTPAAAGDGAGWLIIDDLVDTGTTMLLIRGLLPKAHVGVLYAKPAGRALADHFVREFPQDCWIDFPWEMDGAP
ncbi:MAG TPA: xanthine phosphoribosyltransferase [Alphaproteobacteria bacterium]|nr:xanthine phosphoribosyltransferase [Alphaproteobacteria bacterium]